MEKIRLKGITWNHSRGLLPMAATAQRFNELHPHIEITWEKRSLQEFADLSIGQLAARFDLLMIDHPWAGFAAETAAVLPLDQYLPAGFIDDQRKNSVGRSYGSYTYGGHQWALSIDAATPVASSRPDLLAKHGLLLPARFNDLLELAKQRLVGFSLIPIDTLMSFYMFCCSLGEPPCLRTEEVISEKTGTRALQLFRQLASLVNRDFFEKNPIAVYETMTLTDEIAYCPFAYGYSNYARDGYARKLLHFHDLVSLDGITPMQSTLGGTGLAVSSNCTHRREALMYAEYVASPVCQQTLYFQNGGQPGHLSAWKNEKVNASSSDYFTNTLPALERAFLRPRYHGHMYFQDHAGDYVREYLLDGGQERPLLQKLNDIYHQSQKAQPL
ncbi:ABC transporter substrate-binding protein [Hufsiella ginkgonis]|uniref:Extracellular solute-binding protein n=1 Tax=Hufsiella ginkgonis TaxID=2695274 RepID=A0A7K1XWS4_9SPHI|nr:extracellular solute-binding protein [Hufsiella ginkgonis]MXV15219.1 extracellular solute-binding protein [Hufsiella ginkgonis]